MPACTASGTRRFPRLRLGAAGVVLGLATVCVGVLPAPVASAATFTVTNCLNAGVGSLPYEVGQATAGSTVTFAPVLSSCATHTITLTSATITLARNVTITGPGASALAVSGGNAVSVFSVNADVTVTISGLTLENGSGSGSLPGDQSAFDLGGEIFNDGGTVTVSNSTLSGGTALWGGGIFDLGSLTVTDSTVSDNTNVFEGGGIYVYDGSAAALTNSTVSGNSALQGGGGILASFVASVTLTDSTVSGNSSPFGGGIFNNSGTPTITNSTLSGNEAMQPNCLTPQSSCRAQGGAIYTDGGSVGLSNSTLSGNSATTPNCTVNCIAQGAGIFNEGGPVTLEATIVANSGTAGDCDGSIVDDGYNLFDDDSCGSSGTGDVFGNPDLGPLGNNGGPTQTQALLPLSPAIDKVPTADCPATDQRGAPRTAPCDIGAYDTDVPSFSCPTGTTHYLRAIAATGDVTGVFCVNSAGTGTYAQNGGANGTGTIVTSGPATWISASGPGLSLLGEKTATSSTFTETAPAPMKAGTFTLS